MDSGKEESEIALLSLSDVKSLPRPGLLRHRLRLPPQGLLHSLHLRRRSGTKEPDEDNRMDSEDLLRCLIHVMGRSAVPVDEVRDVVGTGKNRAKAFNLFDGRRSLSEVAHATKINQGNLSRAVAVWVQHGIAFWIGEGKEARLLHVYPIPLKVPRRGKGAQKR